MRSELIRHLGVIGRAAVWLGVCSALAACSGSKGEPQDGPSCLRDLYDCLGADGDCVLHDQGSGQVAVSWDSGASITGPVGLASFDAVGPAGQACFSRSQSGQEIVLTASGQTYRVRRSGTGSVQVTCPDGRVQEDAAGEFPATEVGIDPERLTSCRIAGICSADGDCQAGQVCCQGACHDGERCPGTCDTDADCGQGNRCCEGLCTSLATCQIPCATDHQCDDGEYCNGVETCTNGYCQPSLPVSCHDGVDCTEDACDEAARRCTNTPSDDLCGQDQRCHVSRGCEDVVTCADASVCDDQDTCTADDCLDGICEHEEVDGCCRQDADCDDGAFCNGAERCVANACTAGQAPDCDDGIDCTVDDCDAEREECVSMPINDLCPPGEICVLDRMGCIPSDECEEDSFEDNDDQEHAATIQSMVANLGYLCPDDPDWYTAVLDGQGVPIVLVVMDPDYGSFEVALHNEGGPVPISPEETGAGIVLLQYLNHTFGEHIWIEVKGDPIGEVTGEYLIMLQFEEQ